MEKQINIRLTQKQFDLLKVLEKELGFKTHSDFFRFVIYQVSTDLGYFPHIALSVNDTAVSEANEDKELTD